MEYPDTRSEDTPEHTEDEATVTSMIDTTALTPQSVGDDGSSTAPLDGRDVFTVEGLNVFYGDHHAVSEVDLTVRERRSRRSSAHRDAGSRRCCGASTG